MTLPSNIAKTVGICMYIVQAQQEAWSGERLENILHDICHLIEGTVIHSMHYDFEPYGASSVMMISESHVAAHTYPHLNPMNTLRVDIDLSGCGGLQPLKSLDYLLTFNPDVLTIDYKLRGFNQFGNDKEWEELPSSITDFIDPQLLQQYYAENQQYESMLFTKLMRRDIDDELVSQEVVEIFSKVR